VLAIHLARMMRRAWGEPEMTMAARSPIARWAALRGFVTEAVSLERAGGHRLYHTALEWPQEAKDFLGRFDRVVSLLGGPGEIVSSRLADLVNGEIIAIDPVADAIASRQGVHIARQWSNAIERLGHPLPWAKERRPPRVPADRSRLVSRMNASPDAAVLLIHPGSGGLDKVCPLEALETLAVRASRDGWQIGWMVGPDEVERLGRVFTDRLQATGPVIFEPAVEAAADLVAGGDAFVGNDAGMTHVAALAGVRTVALFGPTDPRVWHPLGPNCQTVTFPGNDDSLAAWLGRVLGLLAAARKPG